MILFSFFSLLFSAQSKKLKAKSYLFPTLSALSFEL